MRKFILKTITGLLFVIGLIALMVDTVDPNAMTLFYASKAVAVSVLTLFFAMTLKYSDVFDDWK